MYKIPTLVLYSRVTLCIYDIHMAQTDILLVLERIDSFHCTLLRLGLRVHACLRFIHCMLCIVDKWLFYTLQHVPGALLEMLP